MLKTRGEQLALETTSRQRQGLSWPGVLLSRQWWWATLVVLLGMALLARLGFWQLDRLAQRRAHNAELAQQLELPRLDLGGAPLPDDPTVLKDRPATATGVFDFSNQVALKHQNWMNAPGIHLITPFIFEGGSRAVLVDRGWLPTDLAEPESWARFDEPGPRTLDGFIQLSQTLPARSDRLVQKTPPGPQLEWYRVDVRAIQNQIPYELLPFYVLQSVPDQGDLDLPHRVQPELDLSDGPHLGYAVQWFIFALILGIIYIRFVGNQEAAGTKGLRED